MSGMDSSRGLLLCGLRLILQILLLSVHIRERSVCDTMTMRRGMCVLLGGCAICVSTLTSQIRTFPYHESFDSARAPLLPAGWSTTKAKASSGDFSTTSSTAYSAPNAVLATDARIPQALVSPLFSFRSRTAHTLEFFERRSSSFTSGLVVEYAIGNDSLAWRRFSDTLLLASSSAYVRRVLALPDSINDRDSVRFRWRTLGNGTGATGTLRFDDITLTVARARDLSLDSMVKLPSGPLLPNTDIACILNVRNRASTPCTCTWTAELYDSTLGRVAASAAFTHAFAASGDSCPCTIVYPSVAPGTHVLSGRIIVGEGDEDTTNNTVRFVLTTSIRERSLVINEIMYEPSSTAGQCEYIEFYNRSTENCDLFGCFITDDPHATNTDRTVIGLSPRAHRMIPAGSYGVIAADSSIGAMISRVASVTDPPILFVVSSLGLNNTGDTIALCDHTGTVIDEVAYAPSWHRARTATAGRSLERINPELPAQDARNWSTCVNREGGTPGSKNSIFTLSLPRDASLVLSPNPFSPDGDGRDDFLGISYALQSTSLSIRVRIYDLAGRLVRTLANNEPSASTGTFFWNGMDDAGRRVRLGIYIVYLEALNLEGTVYRTLKDAAVVAAPL